MIAGLVLQPPHDESHEISQGLSLPAQHLSSNLISQISSPQN
jgi:hypothetical protein